jgi:lysine decarboxylase
VEDFYASDVSISAGFFGTLVDHTGIFAEAEAFAAAAQGADRTMFSVHGSSGSNWIVLRTLALERSDALVLVARNIHHSVINAIKAYGLDFRFIRRPTSRASRPCCRPASDDVLDALTRYPRRWPSSTRARPTRASPPTRARSPRASTRVRPRDGHRRRGVGRPPALPSRPARERDGAGADICVQSTHKLAGGLQQTGLIHWKTARVDSELMEEAYREYVTTSPSYHLLASADAAVRTLAARGEDELGRAIERTLELKEACTPASRPRPHGRPRVDRSHGDRIGGCDLVKTTVGLSRYASAATTSRGARRARDRDREGGPAHDHAHHDLPARPRGGARDGAALHDILAGHCLPATRASRCRPTRSARSTTGPVIHPYLARRYAKSIGHEVRCARRSARSPPRRSRSTRPASR